LPAGWWIHPVDADLSRAGTPSDGVTRVGVTGAATGGVTRVFFLKKTDDLF